MNQPTNGNLGHQWHWSLPRNISHPPRNCSFVEDLQDLAAARGVFCRSDCPLTWTHRYKLVYAPHQHPSTSINYFDRGPETSINPPQILHTSSIHPETSKNIHRFVNKYQSTSRKSPWIPQKSHPKKNPTKMRMFPWGVPRNRWVSHGKLLRSSQEPPKILHKSYTIHPKNLQKSWQNLQIFLEHQ